MSGAFHSDSYLLLQLSHEQRLCFFLFYFIFFYSRCFAMWDTSTICLRVLELLRLPKTFICFFRNCSFTRKKRWAETPATIKKYYIFFKYHNRLICFLGTYMNILMWHSCLSNKKPLLNQQPISLAQHPNRKQELVWLCPKVATSAKKHL